MPKWSAYHRHPTRPVAVDRSRIKTADCARPGEDSAGGAAGAAGGTGGTGAADGAVMPGRRRAGDRYSAESNTGAGGLPHTGTTFPGRAIGASASDPSDPVGRRPGT